METYWTRLLAYIHILSRFSIYFYYIKASEGITNLARKQKKE
ncbi:hypothetical protein B4119_2104 [Parageobacillus caldoxylosilyticus]|uniref:Uncharacterized protein n=1 Tax=Saccharococcus caldoxylosilyticus TaxID=81408 RepID=A0A150LYP2_9BACL|nr:hypothetical protein B4119_2104 [Parageobacillus caldoxylosilyticus]